MRNPNANLSEQRDVAARILDPDNPLDHADATRLAELVIALDNWLSNEGTLPDAWRARFGA